MTLDRYLSLLLAGGLTACATETRDDVCTTIAVSEACPEASEAKASLPDQLCETPSQAVVRVTGGPTRVEDETTTFQGPFPDTGGPEDDPDKVACCYTVETRPIPGSNCVGVVGRPLRGVHGGPQTAPVVASPGWQRA